MNGDLEAQSVSRAKSLAALWEKVLHELSNKQPSQQDTTDCSRTVLDGEERIRS